jgi:hypothetical protein
LDQDCYILNRGYALTRDNDLNFDLSQDLIRTQTIYSGLRLDLLLFLTYLIAQIVRYAGHAKEVQPQFSSLGTSFRKIITFAHSNNAEDLAQALEQLALPVVGTSKDARELFVNELQIAMLQHCDIGHECEMSIDQRELFTNYLYASELLLDCLQLASVSDRAAIEDRLLLPPPG